MAAVAALKAKVAVVTGASRGIGKGIALELGAAGATVYLTGRTVQPATGSVGSLAETAAQIEDMGGVSVAVGCDHSSDADVAALFTRVSEEQGRLDLLVNCVFNSAAFRSTIGRPFWELPISVWHDVVDLGTRSAYVASAQGAALMLQHGERGGLIVNISARGAEQYRYNVVYGVGKAALDRMTSDMALELQDRGVAVVSLWPGTIRTEHMEAMLAAKDEWALKTFPDPEQLETPRFVGRAVAALAAEADPMARTGGRFWAAEIAAAHGLTDEFGRAHPVPE